MRFQIEKKELIKHIQYLASIVPSKNTTPILTNYLLEAMSENSMVRITASDLDITVIAEFKANVLEAGATAILARSFNEIISSLPEEMVNVYKQDEFVKIQCNKIDFNLLCADHTLFPIIPEKSLQSYLNLNAGNFDRMVSKTSFAVSTDVNRAVLNGVCWMIKKDSQLMVATDGRKVAEIKLNLPTSVNQGESEKKEEAIDETLEIAEFSKSLSTSSSQINELDMEKGTEKILPIKALSFLQKVMNEEIPELIVSIEPNRIMFCYGEYTIFTSTIEHKYPDYQKAFVHDLPNTLIINRDLLRSAIRRIALIAPEENLRIRFDINPERFEINTTNREAGDAKQVMENYAFSGSASSISFNFKYMISILDAIDTDNVKIKIGTQRDPLMIYNEEHPQNQEITFLLMPLRS